LQKFDDILRIPTNDPILSLSSSGALSNDSAPLLFTDARTKSLRPHCTPGVILLKRYGGAL